MGANILVSPPTLAVTTIASDSPPRTSMTVRSALWAAWGDAIGFPAELVDEAALSRRISGSPDRLPVAWKRRVGGRMGAIAELPAGAYSDDTQLRLAVSRCVRSGGGFDVETFSKIELPVFLSYQLGAGRGTKAAAQELGRRATRWYSAFFDRHGARYVDGGGNGAAMRVQPHVWASPDLRPETYLPLVLRDAITTHGHPRGILGAALHALTLGSTLSRQEVPDPERWEHIARFLERMADMPAADPVLADRWLPRWQRESGVDWGSSVRATIEEICEQVQVAAEAADDTGEIRGYSQLVSALGGQDPASRGSGTVSAVLALWIAWQGRRDPEKAIRVAARLVGSDTDTIASMAGALVGVLADSDPPGELQDRELVTRESSRLADLGAGLPAESFPHPDPLHWQPPASLADAVGLLDGEIQIAGLGPAELLGRRTRGEGKNAALWEWARTAYGQTLLIKRRDELPNLSAGARPRARGRSSGPVGQGSLLEAADEPRNGASARWIESDREDSPSDDSTMGVTAPVATASQLETERVERREPASAGGQRAASEERPMSPGVRRNPSPAEELPDNVDDAVALVVQTGFERVILSRLLLHLARLEDGPYRAGLFAYRVSEALRRRESR
jgi:ADP-ribosylglycohydrolase